MRGVAREVQLTPDHHLGDGFLIGVGGLDCALILPVAQNGDAVGDLKDLFHAVRNIDDPDALALQIRDHVKEHHLFRIRQRGGGFVKDHRLGVHGERAGDFDHLLIGNRQIAHTGLGIKAHV